MTSYRALWVAADLLIQEPGQFRLVSLHEHVANFEVDGWSSLLMIGDPFVHRGPSSLAVSHEGFIELRRILQSCSTGLFAYGELNLSDGIQKFRIGFGDLVLDFSVPQGLHWNPCTLRMSREFITNCLREQAPICDSFGLLGIESDNDLFLSTFARSVPSVITAIALEDDELLHTSCRSIIGLGTGATPTGDDLIHGAMVTYHYSMRAQGRPPPRFTLSPNLVSMTTPLGRHMLTTGVQGLTCQPVRNYLISLFTGTINSETILELGSIGASTGWDVAIATLLMLDELLRHQSRKRREMIF